MTLPRPVVEASLNNPIDHPSPQTLRIEDYALIGNCRTAALVGLNGSIDWLALPRFDSPSCFSALLGKAENGRWIIAPQDPVLATERRYRGDTMILETRFRTAAGSVVVIDFMPKPAADDMIEVIRLIRGEEGTVAMTMEAIFRFDYGSIVPWVRRADNGIRAVAGPDALLFQTSLPLEGRGPTTVADFTITAGQTIPCTLTWYRSHLPEPTVSDPMIALAETEKSWQDWADQYELQGEWREPVLRSLLTLKALTYKPSGGVVAAPTTSLPESLGGVRNWDYRYCWLRDATFTLYALALSGYRDEAKEWREWLLRAVAGSPEEIQVMYGIRGERRLPEFELPWLDGYAGSKPVRIGNAAYTQRQTDIYGEIMDAFYSAQMAGITTADDDDVQRVQSKMLAFLEKSWNLNDSGIWEMRGPERRHTHSAVMAWVAFDRAIKSAEKFGLEGPVDRWRELCRTIHEEVCSKGVDERGVFVQSYGSNALDAALLRIPLVGFLPADDPRVVRTAETIAKELMVDGYVLRYRSEETTDGLPPNEGTFLICSFWLADNFALMGREQEARAIFERLLAIRNDVGLLAEEYDPRGKRFLGNFPQAFSHIGLINTAHNLSLLKGPANRRSIQ